MINQPITITEFLGQVKNLLESNFRNINVEGEVSNLSSSSTGHWYFTLSDAQSSVSVALFRGDAMRNPVIRNLKDGDKIICTGPIGVYAKRGTFQIIAKTIRPIGLGDLKAKYDALKAKLAKEGLFDLEKKQKIPENVQRVAVVTALGAAALQDFINVYKRRSLWMDITVVPSLVQGDKAAPELIKALGLIQKKGDYDVIVLTRGGGSLEDLWAFNDEKLARTIFACDIPIISAVGHEVDFTIADFVSDLRLETPTAAAQFLTDPQVRIKDRMLHIEKSLASIMQNKLSAAKEAVSLGHPHHLISIIQNKIENLKNKIYKLDITDRLYELTGIHEVYFRMDEAISKMQTQMKRYFIEKNMTLEKNQELLKAYNPQNVLERGYTFISVDSKVVQKAVEFKKIKSDKFKIHFSDNVVEIKQ